MHDPENRTTAATTETATLLPRGCFSFAHPFPSILPLTPLDRRGRTGGGFASRPGKIYLLS
jgi:hypothetical protein